VDQPIHTLLADWGSFYVIAGSVAGALIGLQFVVMALIADAPGRAAGPEIAAFGTPTVIHFCAALLVSALLSAPWTWLLGLQSTLVACGIAGVLYVAIVIRRARRTRQYRPEMEDWIWHALLPLLAYLTLVVAAIVFAPHPDLALSLIAGAALALVFIGIHNAWDTVTFIATDPAHGAEKSRRTEKRKRH
jgi:hypothetical protein